MSGTLRLHHFDGKIKIFFKIQNHNKSKEKQIQMKVKIKMKMETPGTEKLSTN